MGDVESLLAEQLAYYRAQAPEYLETAMPELPDSVLDNAHDRLIAALDAWAPTGDVLEFACGPGTWTSELLRHARSVTAVDGAPEMLTIARTNTGDERVCFVEANLFDWEPDRTYDHVFFGFWLSHVPSERFDAFWSLVDRCLAPGGRVAFADDAYRTADELIEGEASSVIRRRLTDGAEFRAVKVPHTPESLERELARVGWRFTVRYVDGPFFWGQGARAAI